MPTNSNLIKYLIFLLIIIGIGYFIYRQHEKWVYEHNATEFYANKLYDDINEQIEKSGDNKTPTYACLINSYADETCVTPDSNYDNVGFGCVLMFYTGSADGSISESTVVLNKYDYTSKVTLQLNNNLLLIESVYERNNFSILVAPGLMNLSQQPYMVHVLNGDVSVCSADNYKGKCL